MDIEYVKKQDIDGNYMNFVRYNGHIYTDEFPKDVRTRLTQIKDMPIRSDDVILVEYPKSGNIFSLKNYTSRSTFIDQYCLAHMRRSLK